MTLTLTKDYFTNNMFTQITEGGCVLVFNSVQEHCKSKDYSDCIINAINIEVYQNIRGTRYYDSCPCVIGMGNGFITINTDHKELLGSPLTLDNIDKCYFDVTSKSLVQLLQE